MFPRSDQLAQFCRLAAVLLACLWTAGCSLLPSQADIRSYHESTVLRGHVHSAPGDIGRVIVAAYSTESGQPDVADAAQLDSSGDFELFVPRGLYRVAAFLDRNANATLDPGEPCGLAVGSQAASVGRKVLDIELAGPATVCALPWGTKFTGPEGGPPRRAQAGVIGHLDDAPNSSARGRDGYWNPMKALRAVGSNVFLIEPYDEARVPIIFVHGAAGSPQDWRYFIEHIDRRRYQPWIFRYPSGAALAKCAELLFWQLENLQAKLQPTTAVIVAHSMGGMVVRELLVKHGAQLPAIRQFVSLSTPWGGDPFAVIGVELSPTVIPSWIDMTPNGDFIRALFSSALPAGIEHHLFFGYRGPPGRRGSNSDGTVTLASQLSWRAQAEAVTVRGFDEDHESILSSPRVMQEFDRLLAGLVPAPALAPGMPRPTSRGAR
ncbi:MAG: alpha/beta fold hydrolase [Burkholderiales bacterium]|nr:alpha/beta fold hydrolase [Burkholderiales bacterium]